MTAAATVATGGIALLLLAALWVVDRTRSWETPRLEPGVFAMLEGEAEPAQVGRTRVIAVALHCPSCLEELRRVRSQCAAAGCRDLIVLLVDQRERPSASALRNLEAPRVWWDSSGVWRGRWGHRQYGEMLVFDAAGRLEHTLPPHSAPGNRR